MKQTILLPLAFINYYPYLKVLIYRRFPASRRGVILLILSIILAHISPAQIHEPPKGNMSKEDYIVMLIDSLGIAEHQNDTLNVIRYASVLTTQLHGSKIRNRSGYYLDIAFSYSRTFSNQRWYPEVCNRAGMYHFSSRNSEEDGSDAYFRKNDSSISWHKKAIELGAEISNPITQGWGHRGAMSVYTDMHIKELGDYSEEITHHYQEIERIYNTHGADELFIHGSQVYCSFLVHENKSAEMSLVLERLVPMAHKMNVARSLAFLRVLHDFIAMEHNLDTLVALRKQLFVQYDRSVAANHQGKLHEADQKYEVTKTRGQLENTEQELAQSKLIIVFAGSGALIVLIVMLYFYRLNNRNKKLSLRNELLLKEQNHRVKNNLQMINSLLSLQSQKLLSTDARDALNESQSRINSVALLHRMLYEGEELGQVDIRTYLRNLIEEIAYTAPRTIDWRVEVENDLQVSVEKATSLGLIINELSTNSIKHVDDQTSLSIDIHMLQVKDELKLQYADNGEGFDPEVWKTSSSFGNQLIRLQSEQLRGTYSITSDAGCLYSIKIST